MRIIRRFPKRWRVSVVVLRSAGRDARGNPLPDEEIPLDDCLIAPRTTYNAVDLSDQVFARPALYRDFDPAFSFRHTDIIVVPEGKPMAGRWGVDGLPGEWPAGVEIPIARE